MRVVDFMEEFVFLIGVIYPFGEFNIMGIYTDERMLIKVFEKLIKEDARCTDLKYPEIPQIYKIPINRFLGEEMEWAKIDGKSYFWSEENIEAVSIENGNLSDKKNNRYSKVVM